MTLREFSKYIDDDSFAGRFVAAIVVAGAILLAIGALLV